MVSPIRLFTKLVLIVTVNLAVFSVLLIFGLFLVTVFQKPEVSDDRPDYGNTIDFFTSYSKVSPKQVPQVPDELIYHSNPRFKGLDHKTMKTESIYPSIYHDKAKAGNYSGIIAKYKHGEEKSAKSLVYSVTYNFDEFGRRKVKSSAKSGKAQKFVLAFGCSFTLGEGLEEGQDLPSQLQNKVGSKYKVFNFGFHGYSPASVIERIQSYPKYTKGISQKTGVFIWNFFDGHLMRHFCPAPCYNPDSSWILHGPEVEKVNGEFVVLGSLFQSKKLTRRFYQFIRSLPFGDQVYWPNHDFSQAEIDEFFQAIDFISAKIASEKGLTYEQKLFPILFSIHPDLFNKIIVSAKKYNFQVIDLWQMLKYLPQDNITIWGDGHPSSDFNWYASSIISEWILKGYTNSP